MRFGICNEIFERWPWERVCEYSARLGYQGLEVAPFTLADDAASISQETRSDVRECAERHGIQILGLHWLLVKPAGYTSRIPIRLFAAAPAFILTRWSTCAAIW